MFKELKHDWVVRPIYHSSEARIEARIKARIFVAFLAYCLQVSLKAQLRGLAHGITPAEVIAKFKTMQMVGVRVPTTDGHELVLSRYTQPKAESPHAVGSAAPEAARTTTAEDHRQARHRPPPRRAGAVQTFAFGLNSINELAFRRPVEKDGLGLENGRGGFRRYE